MYWLKTTYIDWTKKQGIELLRDDIKFIEKTLNKLPESLHKTIMRDYAMEWLEGIGDSEKASQSQNMGRKRANNWLLKRLE